MSKRNSNKSTKTTKTSTTPMAAKVAEFNKAKLDGASKPAEKVIPKSTGIANGGLTKCNEAVGLHWSVAKSILDDGAKVPEVGDLVLVETPKGDVPLVVRVAQPKVNGDLFCQAFLVERGSGHHEILGKCKDSMVKVFWA